MEAVLRMLKKVGPTVLAIALLSALGMMGCGSSSFLGSDNVTATPTFSPGGGTYNTPRAVNITDTTSGAVMYCTTDGTTPTTSSPKCAQPTTVYQTQFLQAIAVAPGKNPSTVAAAAYTINMNAAATPTFTPSGSTYTSTQQVAIADATTGANIYYTVDGSVPTTASTLYTGPITVSQSQTINAIATASGYANSGVASASYIINQPVALPVFSVPSGNYTSTQTVTISDATPNAMIYYAINSGTPSSSSTPYSGPIKVSQTESISAIAVLGGGSSAIATAAYNVTLPQPPPAPIIYPASGSPIVQGQQIGIVDGDANASIYYTIDGTTPTTSSTPYTADGTTLLNLGAVTINAIAIDGGSSSPVATATYIVSASTVPIPRFSPPNGSTITTTEVVTITEGDANASIYYTTDGSNPTASSTPYPAAGITFSTVGKVTVKAVAIDSGTDSPVATATYQVFPPGTAFSGIVQSGTKPVNGAQVLLYAAGQSGYGSNATALGAPVTTDSSGAFSMQNSGCPASPNDMVYLVATGGDSGNGANSKLEFMAALGPCSKVSSSAQVVVNEVTTVASAYALAQFMTTVPNVGSSSTNYQGLTNAFAVVNNLVDTTTGNALSITPAYAINTVPYLNSSTVPQARINTLADMLSGCADSNGAGAGCSNLFSNATPVSGTAPANTLQAILDIAQNPGASVSQLFGLAAPSGPFQPVLSAAPNDWTLALTFTGAGLGISPDTTGSNGDGPIVNSSLAIDASGDIWVAAYGENFPFGPTFSPIGPLVAEFNNLGAPITPQTTLSADNPPVVQYGGFNPEPGAFGIGLNLLTIDQGGNSWLADSSPSGQILKVSPSLSLLPPAPVLGQIANSLAIDSTGNVWAGGATLGEFQNDGTPVSSYDANYGSLSYLTFDSNLNLWGTGSTIFGPDFFQISTSDGSIVYDAYPSPGGFSYITPVADSTGNIYICGPDSTPSLDVFNAGAQVNSYPVSTGRGCGTQLVLDGNGHIFAVTNSAGGVLVGANVDEFGTNGQLISPATNGYTGTSSGEAPTLNSDPNIFPTGIGIGAAIDGSGNLWVLNNDTNGADANFNPRPGNVLVEFIGLAAPVVTPTSVALTSGQLGVRP